MRREVEIYINTAGFGETVTYKRLDIFSEESINITNSIQDIRDIAKVFTDFTQQFSLPASSPNNLIFKHYYNFDIDGGYDARVKKEALIKINGEDYKKGFLSLNSVSMKNGVAFAYKAVFYGKTVNLNLLFGDDELDNLAVDNTSYLSKFNQIYTSSNVNTGFSDGFNLHPISQTLVTNTSSTTAGDLCYPFISGKSHYYWDSTHDNGPELREEVVSRNVRHHNSSTSHPTGLSMIDLKPAIRLYHIILGIEDRYGITFSKNGTNDFFSTSNASFYELYLWLHREKGDLSSQIAISERKLDLDDYLFINTTPTGQNDPRSNSNKDLVTSIVVDGPDITEIYYNYQIQVTPTGTGLYTLELFDGESGEIIGTSEHSGGGAVTRSYTIQKEFGSGEGTQTFTPIFKVRTQGGITQIAVNSFNIVYNEVDNSGGSAGYTANYTYNGGNAIGVSSGINIVDNMPKMKVIDFLTSIFKMFNLTAFYDGETIKVRTLDKFYDEGTSHDVSQYIHADKHTVDKANIYSKIDFEYQQASTFAIVNSNEITNDEFGNERLSNRSNSISNPLAFDGGTYSVKLGFEHLMYERMTDQNDDTDRTTVQWGWMVSKDENPILGKPLVFYCRKQDTSNYVIFNTNNDDFDQYIRPANTLTTSASTNLQSIHFGEEGDEFFVDNINTESLFNNYYFNYIVPIYNQKSRLSKFEATLPLKLVTKLQLNDKLIISGTSYKINKIQMNINTGKATLELINIVGLDFNSTVVSYQNNSVSLYFSLSIRTLQDLSIGDTMFTDNELNSTAAAGTYTQSGSSNDDTYCDSGCFMVMVLDPLGVITSISCPCP